MSVRLFCLTSLVCCATALPATLEQAERALKQGVASVALQIVEQQNKNTRADTARISLIHAEALLIDSREDQALALLQKPMRDAAHEARRQFLLGEIFIEKGEWSAALRHYSAVPSEAMEQSRSQLGQALVLRELGELQAASDALGEMPCFRSRVLAAELALDRADADQAASIVAALRPESAYEHRLRDYMQARVLLATGDHKQALSLFQDVQSELIGLPYPALLGAAIGHSRALQAMNRLDDAAQPLEKAISLFRNKSGIEILFSELNVIYARQRDASDRMLQEWAGEEPGGLRQQLAAMYLGKMMVREKREEEALEVWKQLAEAGRGLSAEAELQTALLLLHRQRPGQALAATTRGLKLNPDPALAAQLDYVAAQAAYHRGNYQDSSRRFQRVALSDDRLDEKARYNAALAILATGDYDQFLQAYESFSADFPESPLRQDLILEEALVQLKNQDPSGAQTLAVFIRDFPEHPRMADALVAGAEHAYSQGNFAVAEDYLTQADAANPTDLSAERADYLRLVIADARPQRDVDALVAQAQAWLRMHPESPLQGEVRMKLGELLYHAENYLGARTEFETVAESSEDAAMQEKAYFLAAMSAVRSRTRDSIDTGIALFEKAFRLGGSMQHQARLEQATLKARSGQYNDALVLYDSILEGDLVQDVRMEALLGKAETLFNLGSPEELTQSVALFSQVADEPEVASYWRSQALWKKGRSLEKLGDPGNALLAYYEVLETPADTRAAPEFFWSFKCGFDAGRLLEEQRKWESAVALYAKLSAMPGPRAEEAAHREERLRLRHFLWTE